MEIDHSVSEFQFCNPTSKGHSSQLRRASSNNFACWHKWLWLRIFSLSCTTRSTYQNQADYVPVLDLPFNWASKQPFTARRSGWSMSVPSVYKNAFFRPLRFCMPGVCRHAHSVSTRVRLLRTMALILFLPVPAWGNSSTSSRSSMVMTNLALST